MAVKDNVIDFSAYKRKRNGLDKPLFDKPATIHVGDPSKPNSLGKYMVICNFVRYNRQFMALKREDKQEKQYLLVEGIVEDDGTLAKVNPLTEAEYPEIETIFQKIFSKINKKTDTLRGA